MSDWHPIMAAVEGPTGTWRMVDPSGREYGRIEIRRVMNGQQVAYKAVHRGEVIGWAHTLRLACYKILDRPPPTGVRRPETASDRDCPDAASA